MAPRRIPLGGISPMAAPDSEIEKLTNLFICGYHDDWMEKFSRLVGFGFAEYAVYCVLYALHVLGGEGSGDDKKVNIKADENTRKYLAQYEALRPGTVHDTELDKKT
ncbi:unnamed protein product [Rhizophagus irregularis]|uniref:Uncharacterized protein n=1 Tax=Rhizophagus irregularis TaxID=588596 RepID=A0A915ZR55_9GLOM|nr:unnamed protein product [Rhizophagus irregularis]